MSRRPCECEHCTQDRIYRQRARRAEVIQLYEARDPQAMTYRRGALLLMLLGVLGFVGVAASWWVGR